MTNRIDIPTFRELFASDDEFAVIDARPADRFSERHLLSATNLPIDVLIERLPAVVPLRRTRVVLCDENDGCAVQAATLLADFGYQNLALLEGGIQAWQAGGGEVFSGNSVLGKAFGEFVEHQCKTPSITAAQLHHQLQQAQSPLLIDSRTIEEHESFRVPGSILCPGAELAYRVPGAASAEDSIVVHCGGRTRSIVGAQTLIDFGFHNTVSLENGTMAWQFENLELESGHGSTLPALSGKQLAKLRQQARELATRFGVHTISALPTNSTHTRYVIDVREKVDFEVGHIKGSRHIAGGHLLQNVDRYLVVRNADVVLIDTEGVRAPTVAVWLRRMGWPSVFTWQVDSQTDSLITGAEVFDSPREDRELDPNDYPDRDLLMSQNRAYLEWEIGLIDQLSDEPAASRWWVEPTPSLGTGPDFGGSIHTRCE